MAPAGLGHHEPKRIVVKVGSSQIVNSAGDIQYSWIRRLVSDISRWQNDGREVLIVSSGAAALGAKFLPTKRLRWRLEDRQAAAAVGQTRLMNVYAEAMARYDLQVAQLLVTLNDTENRRTHLNVRATLRRLLSCGIIPVVNENDSVSTEELRYGDNDRLAARVAIMVEAGLLVILSDVDGVYDDDPRRNPHAKHIAEIPEITKAIWLMARSSVNPMAHGGMTTKLAAAELAQNAGIACILCQGTQPHPLKQIDDSESLKTIFPPRHTYRAYRKKWIAASVKSAGSLVIDKGAARALQSGKSLLAAGVMTISGDFHRGELVSVYDSDSKRIATGLSGYDSTDCKRIKGMKSIDVLRTLGRATRAEIIHCDDLALV